MADYSKNSDKTLSKAVPTVKADGTVKEWELEVVFSYPAEGFTTNDTPMRRRFTEIEDVSYLNKTPNQFTKAELLSFMNLTQYGRIFDSTYDSLHSAPSEVKDTNFDVNSLQ
jgi:hypothetical protein